MAGVSVATISRVLNHPEQVLPETRERVLAVMREQDYTPNWFARGLNLGKSNIISLLIPTIELRPSPAARGTPCFSARRTVTNRSSPNT